MGIFSFGCKEFLRDLRHGCRLKNVKMGNMTRESISVQERANSVPVSFHVPQDWLVNHTCGFSTAGVYGFSEDRGWWGAKHTASQHQQPDGNGQICMSQQTVAEIGESKNKEK